MYDHKDGISFRKADEDDLDQLLRLKEESWWGTQKVLIANKHDQLDWFLSLPSNQLVLIAMTDHPNVGKRCIPCGVAIFRNIDQIARTCDISGSIFQSYRGSDIVPAAFSAGVDFGFEMLNMHRIGTELLACNLPAKKLIIDHLQFKVEGIRRQAVWKCGSYYDAITLGMLRSEWERMPRVMAYEGSCNINFDTNKAMVMHAKIVREATLGSPDRRPILENG